MRESKAGEAASNDAFPEGDVGGESRAGARYTMSSLGSVRHKLATDLVPRFCLTRFGLKIPKPNLFGNPLGTWP